LTGAVVASLAACDRSDPALDRTQYCPNMIRVVDAQDLTRFGGSGGRDLTDIEFRASFDRIFATCEIDDGQIEAEIEVITSAERGPANQEGVARYSYFVAIADLDENILLRESFPVTIEFEGNRNRIGKRDTLYPEIPLREDETGRNYNLYYGLVLTRSELEYNRANR
jgi:hypothetical protein